MSILHVRLALLIVGIATWFYGVRFDREEVRWLGIAFLAIAIVLRFVRRPRITPDEGPRPDA